MTDDPQGASPSDTTSTGGAEPDTSGEPRRTAVRSFLHKGAELAEELIQENGQLREEVDQLREHNARLRAQVASDDAIRDLAQTIERLERERNDLLRRSEQLEQSRHSDQRKFAEVEQELNDLANLYVANQQIHSSVSVPQVVQQLRDMITQLVGAAEFVIYVAEEPQRAHPVAFEGIDAQALGPVSLSEGPVGDACLTRVPRFKRETPLGRGSLDAPLAVIPLVVEEQSIGAVSILSLLSQKQAWAPIDEELFKLIGEQGAMALVAAGLYERHRDPFQALTDIGSRFQAS